MSVALTACGCSVPTASMGASVRLVDLSAIPASAHEQAMRLAIAEARGNPAFPFGAVILRAADRHVMATGVNKSAANRLFMARSSQLTTTSRATAIAAGMRRSSIPPASPARCA